MKDTSWIKPHLTEYFSPQRNDLKCASLLDEKICLFGGKLYKYYSFEDPYSLKNLYDKTIHFSKPERFNDPFDCALGFSLDKAVAAFLPSVIDTKLELKGENGEQTKQLVKQLVLGEQPSVKGDKTAELISFFFSKPQFVDIMKKHQNGEFSTEEEFNEGLTKLFLEPQTLTDLMILLSKPGNEHLFDNFGNNIGVQTIMDAFIKKPTELVKLLAPDQQTPEIEKGASIISSLSTEKSISQKLVKLAEITGDTSGRIQREFERVKTILTPIIADTKKKINDMFAITCFSEKPDSILMWSHYANKHTGFCVEYDLAKCTSLSAKMLLFPVIYTEERATIPMSLINFEDPTHPKTADLDKFAPDFVVSLLTKSKIWDYENEWRIIEFQSNLTDGHLLLSDMISKVYLGANISSENETAIRNALGKNIPIEKYEIDTENYKLTLSKEKKYG